MKRHLLIVAALTCAGCAPDAFEDMQLGACTEVEVSGDFGLRMIDAESVFLRLRGTPEAVAAAAVETDDSGRVRIQGAALMVDVSCPDLRALQLLGTTAFDLGRVNPPLERLAVYGDSAVTGAGLGTPDLDVRVSGQGSVRLVELDVGNLQVLTGGASQAYLAGSASTLQLDATGQARIDAGALRAQTVTLEATSSSVVSTWATAHLDAVARGNADVVYTGTPDLNVQAEDGASITGASGAQ